MRWKQVEVFNLRAEVLMDLIDGAEALGGGGGGLQDGGAGVSRLPRNFYLLRHFIIITIFSPIVILPIILCFILLI